MTAAPLRAPFPWFGGKSRVAHLVWEAFGDVPNYVEPFAGSLAVLLARPSEPRIETVNDISAMVSNFWRALQADPEAVAHHADWPVNEVDLRARHVWLVKQLPGLRERLMADAEYFDAKVAGWWVWGICQWIGHGWVMETKQGGAGWANGVHARRLEQRTDGRSNPNAEPRRIAIGGRGIGTHKVSLQRSDQRSRSATASTRRHDRSRSGQSSDAGRAEYSSGPSGGTSVRTSGGAARESSEASLTTPGGDFDPVNKLPIIGGGSKGVHADVRLSPPDMHGSRGASGRGVHASGLTKLPKQDRGTDSRLQTDALIDWMHALAARLRRVRVCCGDFERILGPAPTTSIGVTAVFLDPPYSAESGRSKKVYSADDFAVAHRAREWALKHGDDPKLRIALCGYEGEHAMPKNWRCVPWKAAGGYGSRRSENVNAVRERLWFSPHCLAATQGEMFRHG